MILASYKESCVFWCISAFPRNESGNIHTKYKWILFMYHETFPVCTEIGLVYESLVVVLSTLFFFQWNCICAPRHVWKNRSPSPALHGWCVGTMWMLDHGACAQGHHSRVLHLIKNLHCKMHQRKWRHGHAMPTLLSDQGQRAATVMHTLEVQWKDRE